MANNSHTFIQMTDGVRLAATLYFPDGDGSGPWPAILEALPYRKDDVTGSYRPEYARLADDGYVVCRVDVRGTGTSEGIATDEYPALERTDMCAVIEWLATQEWSLGTVGMYGTSYSGFNSIQIAMERPPALKAIIPIYATDDRYADDVHYFGGAFKQLDVIDYPTYMIAMNALPPVPALFGDVWREEWERRFHQTEPWLFTWLEHQRPDDYWQFGSLRPNYDSIEAATMIVAGWADGYRNNTFRTFEALTAPKRLIVGPWAHAATDTSIPGPNIDLVPEMLKWWDRWLKGIDNGVDREPPIVLFAQRSTLPAADRPVVNGTWRYEPTWPPERLRPTALDLSASDANVESGTDGLDRLEVRGDVGVTAWISCAGQLPYGQSTDQRPDELASLTYTWEPLAQDLEILGHATLHVEVTSSAPIAYLSAKLCDVFPDGTSSLVTRGMVNLAHGRGSSDSARLEPGRSYPVEFELEAYSWTFEAGHRIRLDLAGTDWPNAWAPPEPLTLSIDRAASALTLPVLDGPSPVSVVPVLAPPQRPQGSAEPEDPDKGWVLWRIEEDILKKERRAWAGSFNDNEADAAAGLPSFSDLYRGVVGVSTKDPGRAYSDAEATFEVRWPEATCATHTEVKIESDRTSYRVKVELVATENGEERWRRSWDRTFDRDLQ
ncbi:MAG: CocE/NonD family hydrolase [Actinomycetota bacterium]